MNKNSYKIIRIGLALVFLANGLTAFFAPQEFKELLEVSFVSQILPIPISVFLLIIGINDLFMSGLILLNRYKKYVFGWVMIWIIGVMVVVAKPLDILEHLGFFSIAMALWVETISNENKT